MRLLIFTQKVDKNDSVLGFFHRWIEEFSTHVESVIVVCLEEGKHSLPENVKVLSLGKEHVRSRLQYVFYFYKYIWTERKKYDAVFVHMNPEYVVLGGPIFSLLQKPVYLWYVHRQTNLKLRIAAKFAKRIFTSSKESFGIQSKKVLYMGHGIDVGKFALDMPEMISPIKIVHVGRITPIKRIEVIINACNLLKEVGIGVELHLVGEAVSPGDKEYEEEMRALVESYGLQKSVFWGGALPASLAFSNADLSINAAPNGGMDKVVLESLAAKRPAFVTNTAFKNVYGGLFNLFSYSDSDVKGLTEKIKTFLDSPRTIQLEHVAELEERVRVEYDVTTLISRIMNVINGQHS